MKTCSYCGHENNDTAIACSECGEPLPVPQPEPVDPVLTDPHNSLVVVATFGDTVAASILKNRLEEAGIEACIPEELDPSPFGNFPPLARVTVRVTEKDFARAREIMNTPVPESAIENAS